MHDKMVPGKNDLTEDLNSSFVEYTKPVSAGALKRAVRYGEREQNGFLHVVGSLRPSSYRILIKPNVTGTFQIVVRPPPSTSSSYQVFDVTYTELEHGSHPS